MAGSPPCFQLRCSNPTFGWAALGARGPLGVQGEAGDALAEASSPPLPSLPSLCLHPPMTVPLPSYSFLLPPGGSRTIPRGISLPVVFFSFSPFCFHPTSDLRHACWKIRLTHFYHLFRSMGYWSVPPISTLLWFKAGCALMFCCFNVLRRISRCCGGIAVFKSFCLYDILGSMCYLS